LETIFYIAFLIPLLPALLATFLWRYLSTTQRWFAIMLWVIILISFSGRAWTLSTQEANTPFFHVYILAEYIMLLQIFRNMFGHVFRKRLWLILTSSFMIIWIVNVLIGEGWWGYPDYIHALEAVLILVIVLWWLLKMLKEKIISQPERTFEFWLCAGLLVFFSGNFLLFVFSNFLLTTDTEVYMAIWKVHSALIISLYLIYTIALLWVKRTTK